MKHEVQSTVIDWTDQTLTITDTAGEKHSVALDTTIHVTMIGYPDREEKTMVARKLGDYMSRGYVILAIEVED
jgi:hypothetical protein